MKIKISFSGFWCGIVALGLSFQLTAQTHNFLGSEVMPDATDSIDALPYLGELNDFSGGYAIGDTAADFQAWNPNGNSFRLSQAMDAGQHAIIFDGSATCVRFQHDWLYSLSSSTIAWINLHRESFLWVPIYTNEAHALDLENCASNCPDLPIPGPNGSYLQQHVTYADRLAAAAMTHEYIGPGNSSGYGFPFNQLWIDNPDNSIFLEYFKRPAGIVIIDCDGVVVARDDWFGQFFEDPANLSMLETWATPISLEINTDCGFNSTTFSLCTAENIDSDLDGVCDVQEMSEGDDPMNPCDQGGNQFFDLDMDGYCLAWELLMGWDDMNPCLPEGQDTDGDGLCDLIESLGGSNPYNACSPLSTDSDGDGFCDTEEEAMGSDPEDPCDPDSFDTDQDGLCDSEELASGSDPNDICDPFGGDDDGDGLCNRMEELIGSNELDPCDPYFLDTDGDGLCNLEEEIDGTNPQDACDPLNSDSDGDGWCDGGEIAAGTDPGNACDPIFIDSDGDGLCDMEELLAGSDPADACSPDATDTDGDGWCDAYEWAQGTSPWVADAALDVNDLEPTSPFRLRVGPNPTAGDLWLMTDLRPGEEAVSLEWSLRDAQGRLIKHGLGWDGPLQLNVAPGVYSIGVHNWGTARVVVR